MILAVPVTSDDQVSGGWGRAPRVAVAEVRGGAIVSWQPFDVRWDELHDEGTEGGHHARIARFLTEHRIDAVVTGHMGPPMVTMLGRMGIAVRLGAAGDARAAVLAHVAAAVN